MWVTRDTSRDNNRICFWIFVFFSNQRSKQTCGDRREGNYPKRPECARQKDLDPTSRRKSGKFRRAPRGKDQIRWSRRPWSPHQREPWTFKYKIKILDEEQFSIFKVYILIFSSHLAKYPKIFFEEIFLQLGHGDFLAIDLSLVRLVVGLDLWLCNLLKIFVQKIKIWRP